MSDTGTKAAALLALDTTGDACSVALSVGEQTVSRVLSTPRQHAPRLLGLIEELLRQTDTQIGALDAVCFAAGPGSFTGLRIATGVAQGLAFAARLPVIAVSSLATLAQGQVREWQARGEAADQLAILACFDARMSQLYWGCYQPDPHGVVQALGGDRLSEAEAISLPADIHGLGDERTWLGAGSGLLAAPELSARLGLRHSMAEASPLALDVLTLAQPQWVMGCTQSPAEVAPVYLRDQVTHTRTA